MLWITSVFTTDGCIEVLWGSIEVVWGSEMYCIAKRIYDSIFASLVLHKRHFMSSSRLWNSRTDQFTQDKGEILSTSLIWLWLSVLNWNLTFMLVTWKGNIILTVFNYMRIFLSPGNVHITLCYNSQSCKLFFEN